MNEHFVVVTHDFKTVLIVRIGSTNHISYSYNYVCAMSAQLIMMCEIEILQAHTQTFDLIGKSEYWPLFVWLGLTTYLAYGGGSDSGEN